MANERNPAALCSGLVLFAGPPQYSSLGVHGCRQCRSRRSCPARPPPSRLSWTTVRARSPLPPLAAPPRPTSHPLPPQFRLGPAVRLAGTRAGRTGREGTVAGDNGARATGGSIAAVGFAGGARGGLGRWRATAGGGGRLAVLGAPGLAGRFRVADATGRASGGWAGGAPAAAGGEPGGPAILSTFLRGRRRRWLLAAAPRRSFCAPSSSLVASLPAASGRCSRAAGCSRRWSLQAASRLACQIQISLSLLLSLPACWRPSGGHSCWQDYSSGCSLSHSVAGLMALSVGCGLNLLADTRLNWIDGKSSCPSAYGLQTSRFPAHTLCVGLASPDTTGQVLPWLASTPI